MVGRPPHEKSPRSRNRQPFGHSIPPSGVHVGQPAPAFKASTKGKVSFKSILRAFTGRSVPEGDKTR
eukprot:7015245-Ditylum_brightwellii.AAC.1